jgi:hypothetical protein
MHVYFRRDFLLDSVPKVPVRVDISAETEYTLYVNGHKLGFGPPISAPTYHYYDTRDIQPYLRKGPNVIAAHVYSLATGTEDTFKERGLFILEGEVPQNGATTILDTNAKWKCLVPQVWERDAPRQSFQLHYVEIADLRKEPAGWTGVNFDDSSWPPALEAGQPPESAYPHLVARDLGEIDERFLPASSIVRVAEVRRANPDKVPALEVNAEKFLPVHTVNFADLDSLLKGAGNASVTTAVSGNDAAIVFDMGKMVLGCPFFEVVGSAGAIVDVSISEYLEDGRVLASRRIGGTERTNLTDRMTLRDGDQEWQRQDYNAYRFIQLTIRNAHQQVIIRKVGTVLREYHFAREATFASSNPALDAIFNMSKWSHRVNTHWGYCASAWREHAQWSDIVWPAVNEVVFSDRPAMSYYLHQIMLGQNEQGQMVFPYPSTIVAELPEQTMWLARMLWDYGLYFGDVQTMRELLPSMVKANEWFKKHQAPDGLITTVGGWKMWLVIDWGYPFCSSPFNPKPGELATLNMIYYEFLRSVERIAGAVGDKQAAQTFKRQAENLADTINRTYFSPEEARYYEEPGHRSPSQFASTLAVECGLVPPAYREKVFDFAVGHELRPAKASPWFMYEVLETFAAAGRYSDAVSAICRYWGTFLEAGATTFWELWNIPGEDAFPLPGCTREMGAQTITYASGPAPYVVNHILGVQPLELGYGEALIAPHYSGLESAEGKAPTPKGYVHVGWQQDREGNWTDLFLTVPDGLKATVRLPYSKRQPYVRLDNRLFFDGTQFLSDSLTTNPVIKEDYLEFRIAPGNYFFRSSGASKGGEF